MNRVSESIVSKVAQIDWCTVHRCLNAKMQQARQQAVSQAWQTLTNTHLHARIFRLDILATVSTWSLCETISLRSLWNLIGVSEQCTISISGYINSMPLDAMPSQAQWRIRNMNMYFFKLCDGIFYIQLNLKLITMKIYEYFMTCIHISISSVCKNLWINSNHVHTLFYYI